MNHTIVIVFFEALAYRNGDDRRVIIDSWAWQCADCQVGSVGYETEAEATSESRRHAATD